MKPRYPLKKYLGKYETWLLILYGKKSMRYHARFLEQFFNHFPDNTGLEQFGIPDVFEYKKWRESSGAAYGTILSEIKAVYRLYKWAIEDQELPLSNPCKLFAKGRPGKDKIVTQILRRKKDTLRLEEYKRVLEACGTYEPKLKIWLVKLVLNVNVRPRDTSVFQAAAMLKKVMIKAGMPHVTLGFIRRSLRNGLWRDIIRDWNNKVLSDLGDTETCETLLNEPKLGGDAFATIQVTPFNVWPSVSNSSDDPTLVSGISNQEPRTEPQGP